MITIVYRDAASGEWTASLAAAIDVVFAQYPAWGIGPLPPVGGPGEVAVSGEDSWSSDYNTTDLGDGVTHVELL